MTFKYWSRSMLAVCPTLRTTVADGIGKAKDWLLVVLRVGVDGNGVGPEGPGAPDVTGTLVFWEGREPMEADLGVLVSPVPV